MPRTVPGLGLLFAAIVALACTPERSVPPSAAEEESVADQVYEGRGKVVALPQAESTTPHLSVYHEAFPEFVSREGEVVGMSAMTMPFAVAPDVDLSGLNVGDKIAFRLEIRWEESDPARITAVAQLPESTRLGFEAPSPPAEESDR